MQGIVLGTLYYDAKTPKRNLKLKRGTEITSFLNYLLIRDFNNYTHRKRESGGSEIACH